MIPEEYKPMIDKIISNTEEKKVAGKQQVTRKNTY